MQVFQDCDYVIIFRDNQITSAQYHSLQIKLHCTWNTLCKASFNKLEVKIVADGLRCYAGYVKK